jgi:hypothetical protein
MFPRQEMNGFFDLTINPQRSVLVFVQAFEETKVINLSTENNLYQTAPGVKRNYWINLDYSISPSNNIKNPRPI